MKVAEWKRAVCPALPPDEAWEFRGALCYRVPVRQVVQGVLAEGSGFDKGVYIWQVKMPLFVPSDVIDLSWSERIGDGARKYGNLDREALKEAIESAVGGLGSEESTLVELVARCYNEGPNRRVHEVIGYASLLLGNLPAATETLFRAQSGVAEAPWEQDIIERACLIGRILDEEGRDRAIDQLDRWSDQTVNALGLRR